MFPESSRLVYFIVPSILGAIFLFVSMWIFGFRRSEPAGRAFSLFTSSLAIITGTYFNLITTHEFTVMWTFACGLAGGALINLAFVFPVEPRIIITRPYLRWTGVVIGLLLAGYATTTLFNFERPTAYIESWQVIYGFIALGIIFYIFRMYIMLCMRNPRWSKPRYGRF
jgi:hypothetical protein